MHFCSIQSVKVTKNHPNRNGVFVSVFVNLWACVFLLLSVCVLSEMCGCVHTRLRHVHNNNNMQQHASCVHVYVFMHVRAAMHIVFVCAYYWCIDVCGVMTESVRVLAVSFRENTQLGRVTLDQAAVHIAEWLTHWMWSDRVHTWCWTAPLGTESHSRNTRQRPGSGRTVTQQHSNTCCFLRMCCCCWCVY